MNEFIDERNINIWKSLIREYTIEIAQSQNDEYHCYIISKSAIIYVDYNNISKDSFTHELLHIYLKQKEFYLGNSLKLKIQQSNILNRILSEQLITHIGNCLDHLKMFKTYVALGYDKKEFLLDYNVHKCNDFELSEIKNNFKIKKVITPNAIDIYIGKLVAILCDPNNDIDYSKELLEFNKLDSELYSIIIQLVTQTNDFDIESKDIFNSYRDISQNFYSSIVKWINKNKIR